MNIIICDNLKELRKNKGNTQEDLAEFLNVSITAVSKWERGECYPDIELLPKIAAYYDVSVDDLLGVGEIRKQERIKEYEEKSGHLRHIGDMKNDLILWREAQKEFPNDWTVLHSLMYALSSDGEKENSQEIIEIGEKILAHCTDNSKRYGAMQLLCFAHDTLGDTEKAKEYALMAPGIAVTRDVLLSFVLKGDELVKHCQSNIVNFAESLGQEIYLYAWYHGGIKGEEAKRVHHTALKVYELVYENGDYGFYSTRITDIYMKLADIAADEQNKYEMFDYLSNAIKYSIICDTQKDFKHTSPLVNKLEHRNQSSTKNFMSNKSYLVLKEIENKRYDFCREDERFINLVNELKKVAVSGLE